MKYPLSAKWMENLIRLWNLGILLADRTSVDELTLPELGKIIICIDDYNLWFSNNYYHLSVICSQQDLLQAPSHCAYIFCSKTMPEIVGREKLMMIIYYYNN